MCGKEPLNVFSVSQSLPCRVDPLPQEQVDAVVSLHLNAFPDFFLSILGPRFLREFYVSFLMDQAAMAFVACAERDEVVGAIVGPLDPHGFFSRLLRRRWWAFCLAALATALSHPSIVARLIRALRYRGDVPKGSVRALLSSVAVAPSAQGRGVGKALVLRWLEEARRRGASGCYLTTDADNNRAVNGFYLSLSWILESTYTTPEGRKMNRYVYDFDR
jgi:GNAT superfamily N-acetyltransferase